MTTALARLQELRTVRVKREEVTTVVTLAEMSQFYYEYVRARKLLSSNESLRREHFAEFQRKRIAWYEMAFPAFNLAHEGEERS
jgi:hypothetical protein